MKIYLDACCLNRPFDDQSQERIRFEADAVRLILHLCHRQVHRWASSEVIELELSRGADEIRRTAVMDLLRHADERLMLDSEAVKVAAAFVRSGLPAMDALHLAVAARGGCDVLLTTDDRFLKSAKRSGSTIRVDNPAAWVFEGLRP
jgi:predicted nucleic acid-binding protein